MISCPCSSGKLYTECCEPFISGEQLPTTPEQLMRSRYTAYSAANVEYIAQTMKSPALDQFDADDARTWAQSVNWIKLKVLAASMNGDKGFVEFIAYFIDKGKSQTLHEASVFQRIEGRWYYLDGKKPANPGRNDPCLCGSGKKYKKCCGL